MAPSFHVWSSGGVDHSPITLILILILILIHGRVLAKSLYPSIVKDVENLSDSTQMCGLRIFILIRDVEDLSDPTQLRSVA